MKATAEQIKKINLFASLTAEQCSHVAEFVNVMEATPGEELLKEGDFGDTMILIFRGQVEVSKRIIVKTKTGFDPSQKAIIRLETTDPPPSSPPESAPTVAVVKQPAFGMGEFALVLDNAIRTANVVTTTPVEYGVLTLKDFSSIVERDPLIAGPVFFQVAKNAVDNLANASADISNLTQAFFFAISR